MAAISAESNPSGIIKIIIPGPRAVQTSVDDFHAMMLPYLDMDQPRIVIDMSHVEFVDSSFLGALVMTLKRSVAKGGDVKIYGLQVPVRKLFEMLRLFRIFDIHDTEEQACQSF